LHTFKQKSRNMNDFVDGFILSEPTIPKLSYLVKALELL
jgi:hypothetical protein